MAVEEHRRMAVHRAAAKSWGQEVADTSVEMAVPSGHEPATRADVRALRWDADGLRADVEVLRSDVEVLRSDVEVLRSDVDGLRADVAALTRTLDERFAAMDTRWDDKLAAMDERWDLRMESLEHRFTGAFERRLTDGSPPRPGPWCSLSWERWS